MLTKKELNDLDQQLKDAHDIYDMYDMYGSDHNYKEALPLYQKICADTNKCKDNNRSPGWSLYFTAARMLADCYKNTGQTDAAIDLLKSLHLLEPKHSAYPQALADIYSYSGNNIEAKKWRDITEDFKLHLSNIPERSGT